MLVDLLVRLSYHGSGRFSFYCFCLHEIKKEEVARGY